MVSSRAEIQNQRMRNVSCRESNCGFAADRLRWHGGDSERQVVADACDRLSALGGKSQRYAGFGIGILRGPVMAVAAGHGEQEDYYRWHDFSHAHSGTTVSP